ncbi:MAG: DUF2283 domain-containing protein [Planctomycetota bacterium]
MLIQYFKDTDTLYIVLREDGTVETRDLDDNTLLDLDAEGNICAMTLEHTSERTDLKQFSVEGLAA